MKWMRCWIIGKYQIYLRPAIRTSLGYKLPNIALTLAPIDTICSFRARKSATGHFAISKNLVLAWRPFIGLNVLFPLIRSGP